MAEQADLGDLVEGIVGRARPGEQVEAYAAKTTETKVRVFAGAVESFSAIETSGVGVQVLLGGRRGFAYATLADPGTLGRLIDQARENASFAAADPLRGLAEPDGIEPVPVQLYREALVATQADAKVSLALELERATAGADANVRLVESADYDDAVVVVAVASTTGINARSLRTVCSLSAYALAGEGTETQSGYGWTVAREPEGLDVGRAATDAARSATRLLGARSPRPGRLTAIFEPDVTASILEVLAETLSGDAVVKGRSPFASLVGSAIASSALSIVDDPTCADAYGAVGHDGEGLATRSNLLIQGGVLQGFLHNAYTGRRMGASSTGSARRASFRAPAGVGGRALAPVPGSRSHADLIAQVDEGLVVQSVSGMLSGVNPVSGDFSVGVEGIMVRNGELAEPVRQATLAATLPGLLMAVVEVGSDLVWPPGRAGGTTLVVADMALSGA